MEGKSALVFGSTGLVGAYLLEELLQNNKYTSIKLFVRKETGLKHPRIEEYLIDFSELNQKKEQIKGTDVFICLGTTLKKAGSIKKMEQIDHYLPVEIGKIALSNGAKNIAVVSSIGANQNAKNYYLRIKGEMEADILKLPYQNICIARPSLLLGERKEKRTAEIISKYIMKSLGFLFVGKIRKYRAIQGKTVARAMIQALIENKGEMILESDRLQELGK